MQQFVKCNHSIPSNQKDCCKPNEKYLIVAAINPLSHSIIVHFSMFSLIRFVAVSAEKSSSLHRIIIKTKTQTKQRITIEYIFLLIEIRYFILLAISTHIDCSKNSKSVFGAYSKQQQGALKVCLSVFSVRLTSLSFLS